MPTDMTTTDNLPVLGSPVSDKCGVDSRITINGRFIRLGRPRSETFDPLADPQGALQRIRENGPKADIFTFGQRYSEPTPKYEYYREMDSVAVLEIESYEQWWKGTINDKTRNMVRKAGKKGVVVEVSPYTEDLVRGIKHVYDECPVRQGKKSRHFGKSLEIIQREHGTFLDRSEFIVARLEGRIVGFAKVVYSSDFASVMNLIALLGERDKAPTNALLAKVVERCAEKGIRLLHYGVWSRRGFGDFKLHHGFKCREIPRYFVALTAKGTLALKMGLHRPLTDRLPESWLDKLATYRTRYYGWRYPIK